MVDIKKKPKAKVGKLVVPSWVPPDAVQTMQDMQGSHKLEQSTQKVRAAIERVRKTEKKNRERIEDRLNKIKVEYGESITIEQLPDLSDETLGALEEELSGIADEVSQYAIITRQIRRNAGLTNMQRVQLSRMTNGITPLAILISIALDEGETIENRIKAATAAAPYVHKKMPMVIEGNPDKPVRFLSATIDPATLSRLPDEKLFELMDWLRGTGVIIEGEVTDVR